MVLLLRTFLFFERKKSQREKVAEKLRQLHQKFKPLNRAVFIFSMVERSRKTSLHCAKRNFTQKRSFFFTSSLIPGSLACEDISFRLRSITLVKRSAPLPVKFLPGGSKVGDVITARLRRLNFPYTLPNATFNADFLSFSILGSGLSPKVCFYLHRT